MAVNKNLESRACINHGIWYSDRRDQRIVSHSAICGLAVSKYDALDREYCQWYNVLSLNFLLTPFNRRDRGRGPLCTAQCSDVIQCNADWQCRALPVDTKPTMLVYSVSIWIFNKNWIGFINIDHIQFGAWYKACHVIAGVGVVLNLKSSDNSRVVPC